MLAWPLATAWGGLLQGCGATAPRVLADDDEPAGPRWPPDAPAPRVALVLSSGGLRGLAHLGVLRVLESHGLMPQLLVGSSAGALVGGAWASGLDSATLAQRALPEVLDPCGTWWVGPEARQAALERVVLDLVGERSIESLPVRFVAVATARHTGCLQCFGHGDAARALTASAALPGVMAPVRVRGRGYVDGALAAPLPVRVARALGALHVVAVDTGFHAEPEASPGLADAVRHAGWVMARHLALPDREAADLLIEPRLPPGREVRADRGEALVEAGAAAARQALHRLRTLFAGAGPARPAGHAPHFSCPREG